jgi:hypothetical protein
VYADRGEAALAAGDTAEAERRMRFAADSMQLAVQLGVTAEEIRAVLAAGVR